MIITERTLTLRDGRTAVLRSPREADIPSLLELLRNVTEETDFLMRYPEETCEYTPELEQIFIENINGHAHNAMALCVVDGRVVGSCTISTSQRIKLRHRAGIGISVLRDFWGQGIGTALMEALDDSAFSFSRFLISCGEACTDRDGMFSISGLYEKARYGVGYPISWVEDGQTGIGGIVLVSSDTGNLTEMWRVLAQIFFFTAVVVFILAFIASSITSARQAKPLHEMAQAVHKFGHGEFDTRLTGYEGRRDEIGELAAAFNSMADSLSRSEARRSEFVANVSHELKTPMTTIAGFADGILDGTIPPEREKEYLKVISSETRRLSRLVRKMLDLSRLQSAEYVTAQEQFDISEVMLRVLVSLETKVNAKHLDVDTQLPEDPVEVWGDPDAITQVCYNLLDNAIKFSYEESALGISIVTRAGKAYVSVRNHGDTIPPEELPLVFDRFHKTDHSRSEDRDGVGLGLYIVKTILNNHKENITVTSQDGVTEFTFTLTLA